MEGTKETTKDLKIGLEKTGSLLSLGEHDTEYETEKLGPSERRIHVNGQKFKIVPNQAPTKTLFRAIANAVGMCGSDDYKVVRLAILDEMYENWPTYSREVCQFCLVGEKGCLLELQRSDPRVIIETYKKLTSKQSEPPADLELTAAAIRFGFNYSVMELDSIETPIKVRDCPNKAVVENVSVKYHFLKCVFGGFLISYEFLLPIGPLKNIQDCQYPVIIRDVILVERSATGESSTIVDDQTNRPFLGPIPVGFALDHRAFFHRSTITHDLWSLLAELLYGKLIHAPHIKRKIVDTKQNFMLYYLACKAKKRFQVNGNAELQRVANDFNERFSREQPRGNVEDLAQAAAYYNFSYTLIGMDCKGNFYWGDRNTNRDEDDNEDHPYFAFFVKTTPDRSMHWYALEDVGRYCPKEQKLYESVQLGDLREWGGKFYFHDVPRKMQDQSVTPGRFSSRKLMATQTRKLIQARHWASTGIGRLRSSITALYSTSSHRAKSIYRRLTDFIRWLLSRRRIIPDKTVQELFVREKP